MAGKMPQFGNELFRIAPAQEGPLVLFASRSIARTCSCC